MVLLTGALNEPENVIKATCRIKQPCNIPCPLDIPKLLHVGWYCCPKIEECRADWDKHRVAHVQDMKHAYIDYDKYGVQLNGTLTIKKVLPEDDGKTYICRGKIQLSGTVENTTVVTIIEGTIL